MNQKQRIEKYKANATRLEQESWSVAYSEARELLMKGFCEKFVANKCLLSLKTVKELKLSLEV